MILLLLYVKMLTVGLSNLHYLVYLTYPFRGLFWLIRWIYNRIVDSIPYTVRHHTEYNQYIEELIEEAKEEEEWLDIEEELPFIQLWKLNDRESLALKEIIRTPDETAIVYVIGEDSYTKDYRRRVYEGAYIKVDGKKFYLKNR